MQWMDGLLGTPLHSASGDLKLVGLLLEDGASPNIVDSSGATPLRAAAIGHDPDTIKMLIEHGAVALDTYTADCIERLKRHGML
jgi:ankyrin repeat protein